MQPYSDGTVFSVVISEVVAAETVKEIGKIETETAMTSLGILLC